MLTSGIANCEYGTRATRGRTYQDRPRWGVLVAGTGLGGNRGSTGLEFEWGENVAAERKRSTYH
jgi:hypothetical protein